MVDQLPWPSHARPRSKESILQEADSLRALARKARRLAATVTDAADQGSFIRHIKELEESAAKLERVAADAKSG